MTKICTSGQDLSAPSWVPEDYTSSPTETLRDAGAAPEFVRAIREEAQRRVIAETGSSAPIDQPEAWAPKQLNSIMAFNRILMKRLDGTATEQDLAMQSALVSVADKVEAIRARSNALEAAFLAGVSVNISTGQINNNGAGWPE